MGFFANLFKKGEDPQLLYSDEVLGPLEWSVDEEAWLGQCCAHRFSLDYDGQARASADVTSYAREFLSDPTWFEESLATAKKEAKEGYAQFYHAEIETLTFGRIHFYIHKRRRRVFASLEGGRDFRAWRIEYAERRCEGIGFDG